MKSANKNDGHDITRWHDIVLRRCSLVCFPWTGTLKTVSILSPSCQTVLYPPPDCLSVAFPSALPPFPKPHEGIREISALHCHLTSPTSSGWRNSRSFRWMDKVQKVLCRCCDLVYRKSCLVHTFILVSSSFPRYRTIRTGDWSQHSLMLLMLLVGLMMSKTTAPCLRSTSEINASQWIVAILFGKFQYYTKYLFLPEIRIKIRITWWTSARFRWIGIHRILSRIQFRVNIPVGHWLEQEPQILLSLISWTLGRHFMLNNINNMIGDGNDLKCGRTDDRDRGTEWMTGTAASASIFSVPWQAKQKSVLEPGTEYSSSRGAYHWHCN